MVSSGKEACVAFFQLFLEKLGEQSLAAVEVSLFFSHAFQECSERLEISSDHIPLPLNFRVVLCIAEPFTSGEVYKSELKNRQKCFSTQQIF